MEKEFLSVIKENANILYKVCNLYCDETSDRKDLFQEIVLQLWKAWPSFRKESKVSTWMYRIALNTAVSAFRKREKGFFTFSLSGEAFEIPDPAKFSAENENIIELHKAIASLSSVEKAIIMLYLEEKTYREIAEITGISKENVGVKLYRIKSKLEVLLKTKSHEPR